MKRWVATISAFGTLVLSLSVLARERGTWIGTWETSPSGLWNVAKIGTYTVPVPTIVKGTIRYRLRISAGGSHLRLRFSNEYGSKPLSVTAATVGLAAAEGLDALPGSLQRLAFAGEPSIQIPAGAPALSDSIDFPVKPLADLVVSVYVGDGAPIFTCSADESPPNQVIVEGSDVSGSEHLTANKCMYTMRPLISEIDVLVEVPRRVIVAFGDSITDRGVDRKTGERGWAGALSRRLQKSGFSVVNAGISGNRLLESMPMFGVAALSRLDRDVLSVPGVSHIILLEGVNDIGMSGPGGTFGDVPLVSSQELIGAYSQIIARAHEHGIKVIGATILPFEDADYYSADKEKVRAAANEWIRTSNRFDGIIDFDAAMRDPASPGKLKSEYDAGDHLHPNLAGYRHMGEVVDLSLFGH
jgi:lysophospholipase L1-like esterase